MTESNVVVVGAGHGGAQAAIALRQQGYPGSITIVGAEPDLPYERPPLSKEYLAGQKEFDRILIRPARFWQERNIVLRLGSAVTTLNAAEHWLGCEDGARIGYDFLVWAAGGSPRRLSGSSREVERVHAIRSRADVDGLRRDLPECRRVCVIGGGYIGLEAAAVLSRLDREVVVIEAMDRVLARVAGPPVSAFYEAEHRAQGVEIKTGVAVDCIERENGVAAAVRLTDETCIPADLVIVGIGIEPAVEPLKAAGASGANGVEVDEFCRTSLPDIFAVGDCALHRNPYAGGAMIRLESVQNAHDQAVVAANAIAGNPRPYSAMPWFWSNQYDLKLQTVGLSFGYDDFVVRGEPAERSFSVVYLQEGRVVALDCVNAVKDYVQGRALIQSRSRPPRTSLVDPLVQLKTLVPDQMSQAGELSVPRQ